MEANRMEILRRVQAGEISIDDGARLLGESEGEPDPEVIDVQAEPVLQEASAEDLSAFGIERYRNWWLYPLWVGLGTFIFAAGMMSWGFSTGRYFWFACAWLPLLLGLAVLVLSALSRNARWLHVRVKEDRPEKSTNIKISFPLPTGMASWVLRTVGPIIPPLREKGIVEKVVPLLETLNQTDEPLVVEVNDKDGEKVQVYIV